MSIGPLAQNLELFGVSTSAYQIEGAWNEDGKGVSNWDHFTHSKNMTNGDVACDEYHKVSETIQSLKNLGVNVYRFSIAWTRILPNGTGEVNPQGIAYYRYLIAELTKADIRPMVTIYHWDLPQVLEEKGGWTSRDTVNHYVEYAKILFKEFGKEVKYWITHNEPRVVSTRGYGSDSMAPGLNDPSLIPLVNHHLLLSHGLAVKAYRELNLDGQIGISLNLKPIYCFKGGDEALAAVADKAKNTAYLDPLFKGKHPDYSEAPFIHKDDMAIISQPIDFLGVNCYSREVISPTKFEPASTNCLGWETYPEGLHDLLLDLKKRHSNLPPVIITENGFADTVDVGPDKAIDDVQRSSYIQQHVSSVLQAKAEGVNVIGYFVWSLLDNLEWSFGYGPRFGLIHVNFTDQTRTPKKSFFTYQKIISEFLVKHNPSPG